MIELADNFKHFYEKAQEFIENNNNTNNNNEIN